MVTLDDICCYEVSKKVMADFEPIDIHPSGYGNMPLSDYLDDFNQLFDGKDGIELSDIKTKLQSLYTDIIDIVNTKNQ